MLHRTPLNSVLDRPNSTEGQPDCSTAARSEGCLSNAVLAGLKSECASVWYNRGLYERAESIYHVRLMERSNGTTAPARSSTSVQRSNKETCRHGDQEACHHVVKAVWVNKPTFDQAESQFVERFPNQPISAATPRSLPLQSTNHLSQMPCDEGYQSQTPTPPTPASRPINGLPCLSPPLLGVWLQKPLFDRAEASFFQNLYSRNMLPRNPENNNEESRSECVNTVVGMETKPVACEQQNSNDVIAHKGGAPWHFLHADSERVWLDRGRYMEAETRFYEKAAARSIKPSKNHSSQSQKKMTAVDCLAKEKIWFDKPRYDEAERQFYERMNGPTKPKQDSGANSILQDIARARENIQKSLAGSGGPSSADYGELAERVKNLELENQNLHKVVKELSSALSKMESRVSALEMRSAAPAVNGTAPAVSVSQKSAPLPQKTQSAPAKEEDDEDDDDIDLFGSDEEVDEEAERLKEQRLQEYAAKKAKKPALIAKSSILLDVKPWDDETDMAKLEECVRSVQVDGLLWGASKLVPVGYGIKKLQINCVVEDDKVGTDFLEEEITKFEDYVQSVDVAAFNKI